MLARKLSYIVATKYIPVLKRIGEVQVKETGLEYYFAVDAIRKCELLSALADSFLQA
jgi:hypothetical protein